MPSQSASPPRLRLPLLPLAPPPVPTACPPCPPPPPPPPAACARTVYALVPPESRGTDGEFWGVEKSAELGRWLAPFVMQVRREQRSSASACGGDEAACACTAAGCAPAQQQGSLVRSHALAALGHATPPQRPVRLRLCPTARCATTAWCTGPTTSCTTQRIPRTSGGEAPCC